MNSTIRVNKTKLLATLKANKSTHKQEFEDAWAAYVDKMGKVLDSQLALLKKKSADFDAYALGRQPRPEDHTADYDRAIQMMDWEVGEEIVLDEDDFSRLIQDEWQWRSAFAASYTANTNKAFRGKKK